MKTLITALLLSVVGLTIVIPLMIVIGLTDAVTLGLTALSAVLVLSGVTLGASLVERKHNGTKQT